MRLFRLEVKRIMKSRRTLILIAVAILMSVIMAYLPIRYESINCPNENGTVTELDGMAAIRYKRDYYLKTAGEVTPQKMADALRVYQSYVHEYGSVNDIPLEIYIENVMAIRRMLQGLSEAYADPKTGMAVDLIEIDPNDVEQHFYEKCASHLADTMAFEQKDHESAREYATNKYSEIDKPFWLHYSISRDAFDYMELYLFLLEVVCVAIAAPIFASEYQTGSNSILRCTKYGRLKLSVIRILAACSVFAVTFVLGMAIHLTIINLAFGTDCLKTSFQMLYSVINLPGINLGQLQMILALAGLLTILASVSFTMFLSAKCRDSLTVLLVSIAILLLPVFTYSFMPVAMFLPSAGIGMKNNFLYQLCDFNFLHIGKISIWMPYVILISAAVEIPVFLFLAIRAYCRHQVA